MKDSASVKLGGLVRDLLTPVSVRYFVVIRSGSVELLRVVGRRRVEAVLSASGDEAPEDLLERFLDRLGSSASWYGQPFHVLIDHERSFTYRRAVDGGAGRIREIVESFQDDRVELALAVERLANRSTLTIQGVERGLLQSVVKAVTDRNLPVLGITTLAAYIGTSLTSAQGPAVNVLEFPSFTSRVTINERGQFLYSRLSGVSQSEAQTQALPDLRQSLLGADAEPVVRHYSSSGRSNGGAHRQVLPLARLYAPRLGAQSAAPKSLASLSSARVGRVLDIAVGSSKLLAAVLASVAVLLLLAAAATSLMVVGDDPSIQAYQQQYSTRLELEREHEVLIQQEALLPSETDLAAGPAAVVSLFCQQRPWGLYLGALSLRPDDQGNLHVEALGRAKTERIAFNYQQELDRLAGPYTLTFSSLAPEVVANSGKTDTLVSFKLSMVVEHAQAR